MENRTIKRSSNGNMDVQESNKLIVPYINASLDDQRFVLNFIMTVFIGPDVIADIPRKSASRRMSEGSPPYSFSDLGTSFVSLPQLESLYYYICRYAHPSLVLKPCLLHMYLNGHLPNSGILEDTKQFTSFYPLDLHAQLIYHTSVRIFMGIILIDKPNVSHVAPYDFERFRELSRLPYLEILIENFKLFHHDPWAVEEQNMTNLIADGILNEYVAPLSPGNCQNLQNKRRIVKPLQQMAPPQSACPVENSGSPTPCVKGKRGRKKRRANESLPTAPPPFPSPVVPSDNQEVIQDTIQEISAKVHVLPRCPRPSFITLTSNPVSGAENPDIFFALNGTKKKGNYGPQVGVMDIGTNRRAYIIRMALPGIQKNRDQLTCDIEIDGQVNLTGTTRTGEPVVSRNSRVFKMITSHLSPPGQFKVSFKLPGPVDPRMCSFNIQLDGILEIVVGRFKKTRTKYTKKKRSEALVHLNSYHCS